MNTGGGLGIVWGRTPLCSRAGGDLVSACLPAPRRGAGSQACASQRNTATPPSPAPKSFIPMANQSTLAGSSSSAAKAPILIVVIGRTADGKSTLMREVVQPDENGEEIPVKVWRIVHPDGTVTEGTGPHGTTKELNRYTGKEKINGRDVIWIDTPGIGDGDVGTAQLTGLLQDQFDAESIDFLVVTHKLKDANLGTSRQIAQKMMACLTSLPKGVDAA